MHVYATQTLLASITRMSIGYTICISKIDYMHTYATQIVLALIMFMSMQRRYHMHVCATQTE